MTTIFRITRVNAIIPINKPPTEEIITWVSVVANVIPKPTIAMVRRKSGMRILLERSVLFSFGNYIPVYTNHNMECFRNIQKRRLPKWKSSFNVMSIIFSKFILIFFEKVL